MDVIGIPGKIVGAEGKGSGSTKKPRMKHWDEKLKADVWDDTKEVVKPGDPTSIETVEAEAPPKKAEGAMASPGMTGPPRREDFADGIVGESTYRKALKAYQDKLAAQKDTAKANARQ